MSRTDTTRGIRLLSTLAPYLMVVVVLVMTEVGLRIFVPSLDNPLLTEVRYDGIDWYQLNRSYLQKYFPPGTPLIPEFKPVLFRKHKSPNACRVLCLGESSMFGTPYMMTANIPGILRKELRHQCPGQEIEVINLGASAINSNVVRDLSEHLDPLEPDLIIVYMGHNEFYGPEGVGASFLTKHLPFLIPTLYEVRDLRLVKVLSGLLKGRTQPEESELNLMRQVSASGSVRLGSDDAERVFSRFGHNLRAIVRLWQGRKVPIVVSDVSSNLSFPPFRYDTLDAAGFESVLKDIRGGDIARAKESLEEFLRTDTTNAFVNYWLGIVDRAGGNIERARTELIRARDNDLLKFRAPSRINAIIRDVCRADGIAFVSADSLFSALSPSGITDGELFWEHLHPTARGYYEIAALFDSAIRQLRLPPFTSASPRTDLLPFAPDSLSICWLDLACADLSIQHLTGRWPFSNYHADPAVLRAADPALLSIAIDTYTNKMVWDRGCYETASYFMSHGKIREARTSYETVIEEYPFNYYAHYLLGRLLAKCGEGGEAIAHLKISVKSNPAYAYARLDLGLNEINAGRLDEAIAELDTALSLSSRDSLRALVPIIHYGLAAARANKGDYEQALRDLDESLQLRPDYGDALNLRKEIMARMAR